MFNHGFLSSTTEKNLVFIAHPTRSGKLNCFTTMVYDKPPVEFESTTYALRKPLYRKHFI
jgi:hypothetical protein